MVDSKCRGTPQNSDHVLYLHRGDQDRYLTILVRSLSYNEPLILASVSFLAVRIALSKQLGVLMCKLLKTGSILTRKVLISSDIFEM